MSFDLDKRRWMILLAVVAGAALLRIGDSLWHTFSPDQYWSVDLASGSWGELLQKTAADTHPPFYYAMLKVWYVFTPDTLFWAQVLSSLFSAAALVLVFFLARGLFGERAAWFAVVFGAFAPYQIYWGHTARNHAIQPFFIAAVIVLSYAYAERGGRRLWLLLAGAWALAVQTNYMALPAGLVWGMAFLAEPGLEFRRRIKLLAAGLPGVALLVPWMVVLSRQVREGPMNAGFFQETVSPVYLYFHGIFGTMEPYQPPVSGWWMGLFLVFAVVFVFGCVRMEKRRGAWLLLLLMPTVPIALAAAFEWTLAERHLLFALPFFLAVWGAGCDEVWRRSQSRFGSNRSSGAA